MMKNFKINKYLLATIMVALNTWVFASHGAGDFTGSGTEEDPYMLQTKEDIILLSEMGAIDDANYKLANNIDMKGSYIYGIGNDVDGAGQFNANLDGNGYFIRNVIVEPNVSNPQHGFFTKIDGAYTIENLGFMDCSFMGPAEEFAGIVAGYFGGGATLENVFVQGGVCDALRRNGTLFGTTGESSITNVYVTARMQLSHGWGQAGGLIWRAANTTMTNVFFNGVVYSPGNLAPLWNVAEVQSGTTLTNVYHNDTTRVETGVGTYSDFSNISSGSTGVTDITIPDEFTGFNFDSTWKILNGFVVLGIVPDPFPPTAVLEPDYTVYEGQQTVISGTNSSFGLLSGWLDYLWSTADGYPDVTFTHREINYSIQVPGTDITIGLDTILKDTAWVDVPNFTKDTSLMVLLKVFDNEGDTSDFDTLEIFVRTAEDNIIPVANAGNDTTVQYGRQVTLEATGSDGDGDEISYLWTVPEQVAVEDVTARVITFTAPHVLSDTTLNFTLNTYDDHFNAQSADDVVSVHVLANVKPVCTATAASTTVLGTSLVELSATGVSDANGDDITLVWSAPEGITLSDTSITEPRFTAPNVNAQTTYNITLVASDGLLTSDVSTITITVNPLGSNYPPNAINDVREKGLLVFPNPSDGMINLELATDATLLVTNMIGEIIYTQDVFSGTNTVDLTQFPQGMYLLHIQQTNSTHTVKVQFY